MIPGDAELAALLLAIDPRGLKGVVVRGSSRSICEQWNERYLGLLETSLPVRRIPANITEDRLVGGLDFSATIATGRAVADRGVLAAADGGTLVLSAGTTRAATWAHIVRALEAGHVVLERDGLIERHDARFVVLIAQTADGDATPGAPLDRVAFIVDAEACGTAARPQGIHEELERARERLLRVQIDDSMLTALCEGANTLGVLSTRVMLSAVCAARAHAAWRGRATVSQDDLECAARLVLAPRAVDNAESSAVSDTREDGPQPERDAQPPHSTDTTANSESMDSSDQQGEVRVLSEIVVQAARAVVPTGLLAASAALGSRGAGAAGSAGAERAGVRGRQVGTRRGRPTGGARLDLVATLRAAAPMQRVRRTMRAEARTNLVELRRDDFRVRRCVTPSPTTTVFVVDASGSSALHRLAEAKGAIELMLAEGYARRERVAVIAFRGTTASLVLPPTHALARARRAVAGMPAGGGTPLASALDLAAQVVLVARRDSSQVVTVLLTDGRANVARDGSGGRARAQDDALDSARRMATLGGDIVMLDTSARPEPFARKLADAMRARYVALPAMSASGMRDAALSGRANGIQEAVING